MNNKDAAVSRNLEEIFRKLLLEIKNVTGEVPSVSLCIFNQENHGDINYISNCERLDVAEAWKAILIQWEADFSDIALHRKH